MISFLIESLYALKDNTHAAARYMEAYKLGTYMDVVTRKNIPKIIQHALDTYWETYKRGDLG